MHPIDRINLKIEQKKNKRRSIVSTLKALKEFQNDLGTQNVMDTVGVLMVLDRRLKAQIDFLKRKVNVLYEQPRC